MRSVCAHVRQNDVQREVKDGRVGLVALCSRNRIFDTNEPTRSPMQTSGCR